MISIIKYLNEMIGSDEESKEFDRQQRQSLGKKAYEKIYGNGSFDGEKSNPIPKLLKKIPKPQEKQDPGTFTKPLKKIINTIQQ
jgi:hypothetical protein